MTQVAEPTQATSSPTARVHHWIDGSGVPGTSGRSGPVYNPATGELAREVDFASVEEVDAAVAAAKAAFPAGARRALASAPRSCSASATWSTSIAPRSPPT